MAETLVVLLVALLLFLIGRALVLWYFRIYEIVGRLDRMIALLDREASTQAKP